MLREIIGVWVLLVVWLVLGTLASPARWRRPFAKDHLAASLAAGFVLMVGGVSALSGSILVLPALLFLGLAAREWMEFRQHGRPCAGPADERASTAREVIAKLAALAGAGIAAWLVVRWTAWPPMSGDRVGIPHADYGFWSLLARELMATKTESYWAASLGGLASSTSAGGESWYHWSPFWMAGIAGRVFDIEPLRALLGVAAPALFVMAWSAVAALAGVLAPVRGLKAWMAGLAAMVAAAYPTFAFAAGHWLPLLSADQTNEHARYAIVQNLAYWPDIALLLQSLLAGKRGRWTECWMWLFAAAAGSPQTCAFLLMGAATLGVLGSSRESAWWRNKVPPAGAAALMAFVTGSALYGGVAGQGPLLCSTWQDWLVATRNLGIDLVTAALLNSPILWVVAIVAWKERRQSTGPFALACLCSIALGYAAYRWLLPRGDRTHFLAYGTAVIAWPLGWLLLLRTAMSDARPKLRGVAVLCAAFTLICGCADVASFASEMISKMPTVGQQEMHRMKKRLAGRTIGYFAGADGDRVWWLSHHSSWGALLDCRIVRLNVVPIAENYAELELRHGPPALLGARFESLKTDQVALGLALADELRVGIIVETKKDRIPKALKSRLKKIGTVGEMTFFELISHQTATISR